MNTLLKQSLQKRECQVKQTQQHPISCSLPNPSSYKQYLYVLHQMVNCNFIWWQIQSWSEIVLHLLGFSSTKETNCNLVFILQRFCYLIPKCTVYHGILQQWLLDSFFRYVLIIFDLLRYLLLDGFVYIICSVFICLFLLLFPIRYIEFHWNCFYDIIFC